MASSVHQRPAKPLDPTNSERRLLLQSVEKSKVFEKSTRLRELLHFLCEFALSGTEGPLTEQQIGVAVFGREPGYDTAVDTIARVQVSQLRKKLKEYFAGEGSREQTIIDIPAGSYVPVFHRREADEAGPVEVVAAPCVSQRKAPVWTWVSPILFVALCGVTIWAVAAQLRSARSAAAFAPPAAADLLWRPLLGNSRELPVVITDANLMIVSDMLGRTITLREYRDPDYPESTLTLFQDVKTRDLARHILGTYYTGAQDARVVNGLSKLCTRYGVRLAVIPSREYRFNPGDSGNIILVGHDRGNPWMELFEDSMNFHYVWPAGMDHPSIANRNPRPGEQAAYPVEFQHRGYCVVAFRPKPDASGNALLIIGSDLSSLDAGGRFVTETNWIRKLSETLQVNPSTQLPYFEILLETNLLASGSPNFHIVASRIERPSSS